MKQLHISFAKKTVVQRWGMKMGDSSCYGIAEVRALRTHYMPRTENSVQWVHGGPLHWPTFPLQMSASWSYGDWQAPQWLSSQKAKVPKARCSSILLLTTSFPTHQFWHPCSSFHPVTAMAASPTPLLCWHFTRLLLVDIIHFPFIRSSFCAQKILRILHLILTYMFLRNHSKYFFSYASDAWSSNDSSLKCTDK